MPVHKVNVKWGRIRYPDVELNTEEDPKVFKTQLFALTGVLPERQKVMIKGVAIKDSSWGNAPISSDTTVLLMGTKEEDVSTEPEVKPRFVEDMTEVELASVSNMPAGLSNLGNTCYMNATIQCLKTVPELLVSLKLFKDEMTRTVVTARSVTTALRNLYLIMEKGGNVPPIMFWNSLKIVVPRFGEKLEERTLQQDANECWTELIRILQQTLPSVYRDGAETKFNFFVDQYFGVVFDAEFKCSEPINESPTKTEETLLQLSCFISQEVKFMDTGLKSRLVENITKFSPLLNRDAVYIKTSKIKRLPAYLTVQFVRFFYKGKGSVNAKILKEVKFPLDFDAFDMCTEELQSRLAPTRKLFATQDAKVAQSSKRSSFSTPKEKPPAQQDKQDVAYEPYWFANDLGSNNSGFYRLQAVLTHRGRSSSSGHYVAWIYHKNMWVKCDDDVVSQVTEEEVLKLSGGGDWHCAYVLVYGPRQLEVVSEAKNK